MKKKALIIAPQPFFQWRGSPIRVYFVLEALVDLGYEVELLSMPMGNEIPLAGVRIHRPINPFGIRSIPIGPSFWKAVYDVLLLFKGLSLIRRKYDVIHGVEEAGLIALLLGRLSRSRVIFEKHSDPFAYRGSVFRNLILRCYTWVEAFVMRSVDAIIVTGPGLAEQAYRAAPRTSIHHIFDIPSSRAEIDASKAQQVKSELQKRPTELLITYVGSFAVYQGIDLMFASIPLVVRKNRRARFVIIGGTEQEIQDRKHWLDSQGVSAAVTFLGKVAPDDLPNYLSASDVLLCPRLAGKNTPLKTLDYFKAGRPIVAVSSEGNSHLLSRTTAVLAEGNAESFAEAISRLLEDDSLRRTLGEKGLQLFHTIYNFEVFKRLLTACYEEVLQPATQNAPTASGAAALLIRDQDGSIRFWDTNAEYLYGWTSKEAVGNVSHDLLQTEFPEQLELINRCVERQELWRGILTHTTREGETVHVLSRWQRVNLAGNEYQICEINQRVQHKDGGNLKSGLGIQWPICVQWFEELIPFVCETSALAR